jgi:hypothetical protein
MSATNPPLWQVMLQVRWPATPSHKLKLSTDERAELADELRAIADEASKRLSPEESSYPYDGRDLVAWLRTEADRAEGWNNDQTNLT